MILVTELGYSFVATYLIVKSGEMTERRATRPHGQAYDEIRIKTVPYFRVGSVGQCEWRTMKEFQLVKNGKVLDLNMDPDTKWMLVEVVERLLGYRNKAGDDALITEGDQCDQEGCDAPSTVTYRMKALYHGGHKPIDPYTTDTRPLVRKFCDQHKTRGEGYYEDSDDNYELITPLGEIIANTVTEIPEPSNDPTFAIMPMEGM